MSSTIVKKHKPVRSLRENLLKILKDESKKLGELMENKQHKHVA